MNSILIDYLTPSGHVPIINFYIKHLNKNFKFIFLNKKIKEKINKVKKIKYFNFKNNLFLKTYQLAKLFQDFKKQKIKNIVLLSYEPHILFLLGLFIDLDYFKIFVFEHDTLNPKKRFKFFIINFLNKNISHLVYNLNSKKLLIDRFKRKAIFTNHPIMKIINNESSMQNKKIALIPTRHHFNKNNTIVNNDCDGHGGGIFLFESNPLINNNILWGNKQVNSLYDNQIGLFTDDSDPNITYSCIEDDTLGLWTSLSATYNGVYQNNISTDPQFLSPSIDAGLNYDGLLSDWSLNQNSPCINAGNPIINPLLPMYDIAGNPRISGNNIDIGAYERIFNSINELKNPQISVSPNPCNDIINITTKNSIDQISFIDIQGKVLKNINSPHNCQNIQVDDLVKGFYVVYVYSNGVIYTSKLIKR